MAEQTSTEAASPTANQSPEGTAAAISAPASSAPVQHLPISTEPLPEDIDEHVEPVNFDS